MDNFSLTAVQCDASARSRFGLGYAVGAVLLLGLLAAYVPAISGEYIWTDAANVRGKPELGLWNELWRIWTGSDTEQYFPLTYTSFWLERQVWGLQPVASHLVNLALHILNAFVFALCLRRLKVPGAWFAAAIFALHPVHVESVAWIIERKNVLSGFFFLLALLSYLRFEQGARAEAYFHSLVFFAIALLSKSSTVFFPVAVIMARFYLCRPWSRRDLMRIAPFLVLSLLSVAVTMGYDEAKNPFLERELRSGFGERLAVAGLNLWFYLGKLIVPTNLAMVYEKWQIETRSILAYGPALGAVVVAVVLWLMRQRLGRGPLFAALFFGAGILPLLGFFSFYYMIMADVADHFQYLPSLGPIALFAGVAGHWVATQRRSAGRISRAVYWGGAAGLLVALGTLTWRQCHLYKDNYTLWSDTVAESPNSWVAHGMFAKALGSRGQLDLARIHLLKEIELRPKGARGFVTLARLELRLGRREEAEALCRAGIAAAPRFPSSYLLLAEINVLRGRLAEAIVVYEDVLRMPVLRRPAGVHYRLAVALRKDGQKAKAGAHFRMALELDPKLRQNGLGRPKEDRWRLGE